MTNASVAVTKLTDWARKPEIFSGIVVGAVIGPVEGVTVVREPPTGGTVVREPPTGGTVVEDDDAFGAVHAASNTRVTTTPPVTKDRRVLWAVVRHAPGDLCLALRPRRTPAGVPTRFTSNQ